MATSNNLGDVVPGTLIQLPGDDTLYIVGEIYINGKCKLYSKDKLLYKGLYEIAKIKSYVR